MRCANCEGEEFEEKDSMVVCMECGREVDEDTEVGIIASGYEWTCPIDGTLNHEPEYNSHVTCEKCQNTFKAGLPEHAYG
jgi:hypothetical protein